MFILGSQYAQNKAKDIWWRSILLGLIGGLFIGLGYVGYHAIHGWDYHLDAATNKLVSKHSIAANALAALMFPAGLLLIIVLGGTLFTSHNLIMISVLDKKTKIKVMLIQWGYALLGNAMGTCLMALIAAWSGLYGYDGHTNGALQSAIDVAQTKDIWSHWWNYLLSGIICNILVAGTVWAAVASKENKAAVALIIIFLIWFFAVVAPQHVVANMYAYFIVAIKAPSSIDHGGFIIGNLLPTTIGNIIGGGILLPVVYWLIYSYKIKKAH